MIERITVVCRIHGAWSLIANSHIQGAGCPKCASEAKRVTFNDFVERARLRHGKKYDYPNYDSWNEPTDIICREHGIFRQRPSAHCKGARCPRCAGKKVWDTQSFIKECELIHNGKYDYSLVNYVKSNRKVTIVCPTHGKFEQLPNTHVRGSGCEKCIRVVDQNTFLEKAREIHGDTYSYERAVFIKSNLKTLITCKIHGDFSQIPNSHLNGNGCPKCAGNLLTDTSKFVEKARYVHGERYDYSKAVYTRNRDLLTIVCPTHGSFEQAPDHHLRPQGCPRCGFSLSRGEEELGSFIETLGEKVLKRSKSIIPPMELDVYLPERSLGIEYCGLFWHSEAGKKDRHYHKKKLDLCKERRIDLITLYEDEWTLNRSVVESVLKNRLHRSEMGEGARHHRLEYLSSYQCRSFLNSHHLRGMVRGKTVAIGSFLNDTLCSVMTFSPSRDNKRTELSRFCTDGRVYSGIASRLFRKYTKDHGTEEVISFSDERWYRGNLYMSLGFERDIDLPPDYEYLWKNQRYHKSTFRREKLTKRFQLEGTEREITKSIRAYRIYDCGKTRWVWRKNHVIA